MKKAIFTVNTGDYDNLPFPANVSDWDKVLFTDSTAPQKRGWTKIIILQKTDRPDLLAKEIKWLSHKYLPEYDLVCYADSNMLFKKSPPSVPFKLIHPRRTTVTQECEACNKYLHRWSRESINEELKYFNENNFPDDVGLYQNGFFVRAHDEISNKIGEGVVEIMRKYTTRDQIALPYVIWKMGYSYPKETLKTSVFFNTYIRMVNHKNLTPKILHIDTLPPPEPSTQPSHSNIPAPPTVYYFTPARADKNIGKTLNDHCSLVPNDDDWICIRDNDTMFLTPNYSQQIEEIITRYKDKYDLIGCMTNRLGLTHQLYNGKMSDDTNIKNHMNIAFLLENKHWAEVIPSKENIAGLFLLFPKKTWNKNKFEEGSIMIKKGSKQGFFDFWFSDYVKKRGKIGIVRGLYIFHLYRLFNNDRKNIEHLLI
jgi:hypothetical protein